MKKIIFITLLFCGLAFTAQSQSLTYSKVILLTALETDTVPQGKVWKVVSYQTNESAGQDVQINVNSSMMKLYTSYWQHAQNPWGGNSYTAATHTRQTPLPMWLPAGTTIELMTGCEGLSIIEFTENNE
jgi:hypothetical protein